MWGSCFWQRTSTPSSSSSSSSSSSPPLVFKQLPLPITTPHVITASRHSMLSGSMTSFVVQGGRVARRCAATSWWLLVPQSGRAGAVGKYCRPTVWLDLLVVLVPQTGRAGAVGKYCRPTVWLDLLVVLVPQTGRAGADGKSPSHTSPPWQGSICWWFGCPRVAEQELIEDHLPVYETPTRIWSPEAPRTCPAGAGWCPREAEQELIENHLPIGDPH